MSSLNASPPQIVLAQMRSIMSCNRCAIQHYSTTRCRVNRAAASKFMARVTSIQSPNRSGQCCSTRVNRILSERPRPAHTWSIFGIRGASTRGFALSVRTIRTWPTRRYPVTWRWRSSIVRWCLRQVGRIFKIQQKVCKICVIRKLLNRS